MCVFFKNKKEKIKKKYEVLNRYEYLIIRNVSDKKN